ncbi:MAG TPA: SRPBCC family protein [Thermoleophilaceae bacterium]|nr:SRPBCC family protein [Thermoleophilaceae bacterium]
MSAAAEVPLEPPEALRLWADVGRWPSFVEGFARVGELSPDWPEPGSKVVWLSHPGGRGRVTEKVIASDPLRFSTRVFEERLAGTQTAEVAPAQGGARVDVQLEYELATGGPLRVVGDLLFVRRALRAALTRTLGRFAVEAQDDAGLR